MCSAKRAKCLGLRALDSPLARWQNHASVSCVPRRAISDVPSASSAPFGRCVITTTDHGTGAVSLKLQFVTILCGVISSVLGTLASAVNPAVPNVKDSEAMSEATVSNTIGAHGTSATTEIELPPCDSELGLVAVPNEGSRSHVGRARHRGRVQSLRSRSHSAAVNLVPRPCRHCFEHERSTRNHCDHCARVAAGRK